MQKTIYTDEHAVFLAKLREARERAGLTQVDAAARMEVTQSFVSKCERGERRLDIVELNSWCRALGISLAKFAGELEKTLGKTRKR